MSRNQRTGRRYNFLPPIIFLVLVFITAVSGAYVALRLFGDSGETAELPEVITIEIIITATPAPTPLQSLAASGQTGQVNLPTGLAGADAPGAVATVDADRIGAVDVILLSPTPESAVELLPENCLLHVVRSGDTPFGIAARYGADRDLMLRANNLTLESAVRLQVGDEVLVPLEGCDVAGVLGDSSGQFADLATPDPTVIAIELMAVEGIGDITSEGIRLRNNGAQLNVTGWTLSDASGNSFAFPELLLFPDAEIYLYSRSGRSTGYALFWGKDESVWQAGEEITIADASGVIQVTLTIPFQ